MGSVPVLDSFILAFGEGGKIVNGLPAYASTPRYKYLNRFAPQLGLRPRMQGAGNEPDLEELLRASPDVTFTLDLPTAELLEKNGIATVFLAWRQPDDAKRLMRLVG